jgi:hypothetical protein
MFNEREKNPESLTDELRHYCDELSEFNRRCERLCEAIAAIATHHESISSFSVRGMRHNANWLKYRVNDFNRRLRNLYEKARDDNNLFKQWQSTACRTVPPTSRGGETDTHDKHNYHFNWYF